MNPDPCRDYGESKAELIPLAANCLNSAAALVALAHGPVTEEAEMLSSALRITFELRSYCLTRLNQLVDPSYEASLTLVVRNDVEAHKQRLLAIIEAASMQR